MTMLFEMERMQRLSRDLKKLIYTDTCPITYYKVFYGEKKDGYCCPTDTWDEIAIDTVWKNTDEHRWYRTHFTIPEEMDGKHVEFRFRTAGIDNGEDMTNPQMLFYLNGEIRQGIDLHHREVTVSFCAKAGDTYEAAFYVYSGSEPGDLILYTDLAVVDDLIQKVYYDFQVPTESARVLQHVDPENHRRILKKLAPAAEKLDLRKPYSNGFYESLKEADVILEQAFYHDEEEESSELKEGEPIVSAIGHTHIDIAWLWTVAQTREKVLRSFSTVLQLMEQYPDYTFMSSQPILYAFVKEQEPWLYARIQERIKEGRWEVDGAMWLEPDCNLPCGESLVRQILKGHQFIKEEFEKESKSLWLPDVFGYSAALPQILKKSGISYFMTNKLTWNQYNELPNDTFLWKGIDGSEIFVFMPTSCAYTKIFGSGKPLNEIHNSTTYTGNLDPDYALGTFKRFQNKDLSEHTLLLYGYGDGGGGPTKEMLENGKRLKHRIPGIPRVVQEKEGDFFDAFYKEVKENPELPSWTGELYFEFHRGTYTSMAKNKRNNRKSEILYEQLETLSCMGKKFGIQCPTEILQKGWNTILINQFHDIIPGTCIEPVYENTDLEYQEIMEAGQQEIRRMTEEIAKQVSVGLCGRTLTVFNTQGYCRDDVIILPKKENGIISSMDSILAKDGTSLPIQCLENGDYICYLKKLPAFGCQTFFIQENAEKAEPPAHKDSYGLYMTANGCIFENKYFRAIFDKRMELTSLYEKRQEREFLKEGRRGNVITAYEDRPINWDNWNIDPFYRKKPYEADWHSVPELTECGPVRSTVRIQHGFQDSVVTQEIHFYPELPRIDFETHADWKEHNVLLKVNFPTNINAAKAAYEIQFGNVERETTCNHSYDTAKFEVCAHKWADLSENNAGVSLLNDCKYGHSIRNGEMEITLIKAGTYPNPNADIGKHEFVYSVYPHSGRWQEAYTIEQAYNLNVPLLAVVRKEKDTVSSTEGKVVPPQKELVSCSHKNCFAEVIKPAEDGNGFILRMYENRNSRTKARIQINIPFERIYECNLLEENEREIPVNDGSFEIVFLPYEIKSFRIQ